MKELKNIILEKLKLSKNIDDNNFDIVNNICETLGLNNIINDLSDYNKIEDVISEWLKEIKFNENNNIQYYANTIELNKLIDFHIIDLKTSKNIKLFNLIRCIKDIANKSITIFKNNKLEIIKGTYVLKFKYTIKENINNGCSYKFIYAYCYSDQLLTYEKFT